MSTDAGFFNATKGKILLGGGSFLVRSISRAGARDWLLRVFFSWRFRARSKPGQTA